MRQPFRLVGCPFIKPQNLTRVLIYIYTIVFFLIGAPLLAQYEFIENKGQWDGRVLYRASVPAGYLHLEKNGFNWYFYDDDAFGQIVQRHSGHHAEDNTPTSFKYNVLKLDFVNSNPIQNITPSFPSPPHYNYYYGKNPENWATGVKGYYHLQLPNVWNGVDIKLYNSPQGLKYDFVIQPGTLVKTIQLQYKGAEAMLLQNGKLYIKTTVNTLVEEIPEAYQYIGDKKIKVDCRYVLNNNNLSFETGNYNPNYPLVIDPVLVFVTYSGSTADNFGFTATYDSKGNLYAGGNVTEPYQILPNGKYPTTAGAFQQTFAGNISSNGPDSHFPCDIAISKYDSSGKKLLYATYLGGTDNDYPHSLVVDNNDMLIMLGSTYSTDFPVKKNCFDTLKNGNGVNADIVLVKLNDDGTALLGSTFIGGRNDDGINAGPLVYNYADNYRGDVMVDNKGTIYVASCSNSTDFPLRNSTQTSITLGNVYDGVAFSIDPNLETLLWSTYLGGTGQDALYTIKLDDSENVIVGGGTTSTDLATTGAAVSRTYLGGLADGFVAVFDSTTSKTLKHLSYYGSAGYDQVYFVDIDKNNLIYVAGQTEGNIPIKNAAYGQPGRGQFIAKLNKGLDSLIFSTTIGNRIGNPDISPTAFLVDNCDNIYFSGWGSDVSVNNRSGSSIGLPVTPGAIQSNTDGNDFWVGVLTPGAQSLYYATFFGGSQTDDHVDGGTSRFDKRGVIYQSVCGSCPGPRSNPNFVTDMPTTPGAAYQTNLSPRCSNTSFKLDFQISYSVDAGFDVSPKLGCSPMTVNISDYSFNALKYFYDFGDGTTDTVKNPTHTYTQPGKYTIKQIISNPFSCNLADSFVRIVEVITSTVPRFSLSQKECESGKATFTNESDPSLGFLWRFGDGNTSTDLNPEHEYTAPGTYMVTLITNPGSLCIDSITKSITLKDYSDSEWKFPNVFTPDNKDTLNNCFTFEGLLVDCDKVKIKIFNRWGELIWKTESVAACWDGTHYTNGKKIPAGVYFIQAELERIAGETKKYNGTVTLIR